MDSENRIYNVWLDIEEYDEQTEQAEEMDAPGAALATFETYKEAWDYAEHVSRIAGARPFHGDDATGAAEADKTPPAKDGLPEHVAKAIDEVLWYLWQEAIEGFIADEPAPDDPHIFRALATVDGWFYGHEADAEELVRDFYQEPDREAARRRVRSFRG